MQPLNRDSKLAMIEGGLGHLPPLRIWFLLGLLLLSLLVSGCVRSELQINYQGQAGGEIIQHIELAEPLTPVSEIAAQPWFDQIERQARQLRGRTQRLNQREMRVKIPFGTAQELEQRLNQFVQTPQLKPRQQTATPPPLLPVIQSRFRVQEQNFLLFVRDRLSFDLDLRALGLQSPEGELILSPDSLVDLKFSLQTPWGGRSIQPKRPDQALAFPTARRRGKTLTWTLQPGQQNHLEAVFWYPSLVGWGAIAITLLIAAGLYLKYGASLGLVPTRIAPADAEAGQPLSRGANSSITR